MCSLTRAGEMDDTQQVALRVCESAMARYGHVAACAMAIKNPTPQVNRLHVPLPHACSAIATLGER